MHDDLVAFGYSALGQVLEIHNLGSQSYQLKLKSDPRMIPVSRRRLAALQSSLGI